MNINDYPSNSHKSRKEGGVPAKTGERPKRDKVVTGTVKTRKKSELRKLSDVFIAEDAKNVKSYVFMDVLVPAIKDAVYNIVVDGIGMILGKPIRGRGATPGNGKTSYNGYYGRNDSYRSDYRTPRVRTAFDDFDFTFESRGEADVVLHELRGIVREYGLARVGDLYDLAGLTAPFTANDYGWTNLDKADVMRIREGWIIQLPKAIPLD